MTSGAQPRFADDPYAQWIRSCLEERGWDKQDLAAEVLRVHRAEGGTRIGEAGAEALVRRATHGIRIAEKNRDLIAKVLGEQPQSDPRPALEAEVARLSAALEIARRAHIRLRGRVAALERAAGLRPPRSREAEIATRARPSRLGKPAS